MPRLGLEERYVRIAGELSKPQQLKDRAMERTETCEVCGSNKNLKTGWTNHSFCCESHERSYVSNLHASMPGAGKAPSPNWVPYHIGREISRRWES